MNQRCLFVAMLVAAGCGAGAPTSQSLPVTPARGIVLISIDTLRADHLGAYGYHRDTSPFFDALADQGTLYENAIVQYPSTLTSHMSIFTGLFPHEHGVFPPDSVLPEAIQSVTQILKRAGFRTAGHTEGGFVAGRFGFDRGFDDYTDPDATSEMDVEDTFARGVEFLSTLGPQDRFFLFLHTYAVHDPYTPPADYRSLFYDADPPADTDSSGRRLRAVNRGTDHIDDFTADYFVSQYDASIRWVDDVLQRFFDQLTALDLRRDTAIIITSDHGEEFLEHGRLAHTQVYPECVRVPLLIIHPGAGEVAAERSSPSSSPGPDRRVSPVHTRRPTSAATTATRADARTSKSRPTKVRQFNTITIRAIVHGLPMNGNVGRIVAPGITPLPTPIQCGA